MNKKYQQRPAEKPGAMILEELREQELRDEEQESRDNIVVECSLELDNEWANESI